MQDTSIVTDYVCSLRFTNVGQGFALDPSSRGRSSPWRSHPPVKVWEVL